MTDAWVHAGNSTPVVMRLCASLAELPREQCAVPERCVDRECSQCGQLVHYDPRASIPLLGAELIICGECFDASPDFDPR